jgi:hypothetical protein
MGHERPSNEVDSFSATEATEGQMHVKGVRA